MSNDERLDGDLRMTGILDESGERHEFSVFRNQPVRDSVQFVRSQQNQSGEIGAGG